MEPTLALPDHPELFVVGDLCCLTGGRSGPGGRPRRDAGGPAGRAQRAARDSRETAAAVRYQNKGSLATIGRSAAVAEFGRVQFGGPLAWLAWLFIHVMFLIGFRNRLIVTFQWMWSYLSYDRGARLITGPLHRDPDQPRAERRITSHVASR